MSFFSPGQTETSQNEAYLYAVAIIVIFLLRVTYTHNCTFYMNQLSIKINAATCGLLYRTVLKLNQASIMEMSSGKVVTFISKDIYTFDWAISFGHEIFIGIIEVMVMTYVMYSVIGISALVGVGFMIIIIPTQCKYAINSSFVVTGVRHFHNTSYELHRKDTLTII